MDARGSFGRLQACVANSVSVLSGGVKEGWAGMFDGRLGYENKTQKVR